MKKINSLKLKLTLGVGLLFFSMILILTAFSVISMERLFVVPVQKVVPAMPLIPTNSTLAQQTYDAGTITAAIDTAQVQFNMWAFVTMIIIGAIGTVCTYYFIKKTIKPLDKFSTEIASINENIMNQPPQIETNITEIKQLSNSFDKMLERLNTSFENQKKFSTAVAHELKTPLAVIKTNIDILEMDVEKSTDDYEEIVNITKKQVERMNDIIENLLLTSSSKSYEFNDKISIKKMMRQLLIELDYKIIEKNITIHNKIDDFEISGSDVMLSRAFSNLIDNAIKYSNCDNPTIDIYTDLSNGNCVIIQDNGIGIEEKELENIFEPFYRVDQSRSRKIAGSGLGLSIVKEIIEAHHGKIEITSKLGQGTTIKIKFN